MFCLLEGYLNAKIILFTHSVRRIVHIQYDLHLICLVIGLLNSSQCWNNKIKKKWCLECRRKFQLNTLLWLALSTDDCSQHYISMISTWFYSDSHNFDSFILIHRLELRLGFGTDFFIWFHSDSQCLGLNQFNSDLIRCQELRLGIVTYFPIQ